MKKIFFTTLILIALVTLSGIEVGGHITQDTVWGPENNPYLVSTALYVDSGVTLTLLPGTQMRFVSAFIRNEDGFKWNGRFEPRAKVIIVRGTLVAVGTTDNPISFDRDRPDNDYKWGGIYISPNAPKSTFKYCEFRNTYRSLFASEQLFKGAIHFANGIINISNCIFENNLTAIETKNLCSNLLIYKCKFISINDPYPQPYYSATHLSLSIASLSEPVIPYPLVTIANCNIIGSGQFASFGYYIDKFFLNNVAGGSVDNETESLELRHELGSWSSYGNVMIGVNKGVGCRSATVTDTVFARRNRLIKLEDTNPPITALNFTSEGFGTNYVSDNYLQGYVRIYGQLRFYASSYIYNNVIENSLYYRALLDFQTINPNIQSGQSRVFNNLFICDGGQTLWVVETTYSSPFFYNNTILGFRSLYEISGGYSMYLSNMQFENNIITCSQWETGSLVYFPPLLRNNCLAIEPWESIDGGGNFVADPVFADTQNADYTLAEGSPCIDAGILRPDLPDFDLRYHRRISSATEGGPRAVDIGAYEYNSVYIGGIVGFIYDSQSGLPVDCAKVEILDKLPEFSDNLGSFHYPTGAGIYTLKVSRWDYQDLIIPGVQVILGENTTLNIPLVNVHDSDIADEVPAPEATNFGLCNYPNPFNPRTMISFIAPQSGEARLSIFNVKGQKIKTLYQGSIAQGYHQLAWDAQDEKGSAIASGIYFAIIEINGKSQVHKMMLIK